MNSCADSQENVSLETQEETKTEVDTSTLIDFKGLPVSHRFSTPVEELEVAVDTEESLTALYNKTRVSNAKKKGLSLKTVEEELPSPEAIVAACDKVDELFPYQDPEEESDEEYNADMDMIAADFPTLSKEEIVDNIDLIDEYYSQNLNYVVLNEIAENEEEYQNITSLSAKTNSDMYRFLCTLWKFQNGAHLLYDLFQLGFLFKSGEFNYIRSIRAMYYAQRYAQSAVNQEYSSSSDNIGDAYKHTLWSAYLAQYYYTTTSKSKRLKFAEAVTYAYESCSINDLDAREMDYHNNYIGRKLWDDATSYRKWWRWTVGLRKPSLATMQSKAKELMKKAVYIDKSSLGNTDNERIINTQKAILKIDKNTIVYIKK